jgi:2'-5' RNA ligase
VTLPASFEGRDRARLFCGLRLSQEALDSLSSWQSEQLTGGRVVPRENLHVTLAFLGHRPVGELASIFEALRGAAPEAGPIRLVPERYRETRSVGMLVLTDAGSRATRFAEDLQSRLERLGLYRREGRPWLPHLTVLRFKERPRLRPPLPDTGELVPSDAAVFMSELRPAGARYVVVESFALGR